MDDKDVEDRLVFAREMARGNGALADKRTILEEAQHALLSLNCSHPDGSVGALEQVLARLAPDSPDAIIIKRAIGRLEELAAEVEKVERVLADASFSFGRLEL